jgi:hypothetical protein
VEIGTEAAQFPGKEYINGIFLAVFLSCAVFSRNLFKSPMKILSFSAFLGKHRSTGF